MGGMAPVAPAWKPQGMLLVLLCGRLLLLLCGRLLLVLLLPVD